MSDDVAFWKHFLAGNIGGIFGLSLCYPLDTCKVRMQTRPAGTYNGILHCITSMIKYEGFASLYRGLLSPVIGYGLIKSSAFGSYNQMKAWTSKYARSDSRNNQINVIQLTLCGAYAGFVQTFVRAPVEQIKIVMQARNKLGSSTLPPYANTIACIVDVLRSEGVVVGLYRAFIPTLTREIPQYAIYYPTYEVCKHWLVKANNAASSDELHWSWLMLSGGVAGVAQWIPTYALDVIKSRISAAEPGTYRGFVDCAATIARTEGISAFWRGLSAAVIRAFPLHGAVFVGYEIAIKLMR